MPVRIAPRTSLIVTPGLSVPIGATTILTRGARNEAMSDLFQYIAVFYNRRRRHSTLGYLSPTTFLQNWIERQDQQEMAA